MKKIVLVLIFIGLYSCENKQYPECADVDVKSTALEIINDKLYSDLVENYMSENFNQWDIAEYAKDNGYNTKEYVENEKQKVNKLAENYANEILKKSSVFNIRTNKIDKEIKKCSCSAELNNPDLKEINMDYTAQYLEDSDKVYVELTFDLK